jgi:hypothetical protein
MNTETYEPANDTAIATTTPIEEQPIHLARCVECGHSVSFRPNATGNGFFLVGTDALYGIGAFGRPVCPDGHGEMEIADDRLPIEQAIAQTAERIDATTQRLPFPSPPFNYEGVLHALCEKRHTIAALEKRVEDRRDLLKKAKDDLDEANTELGKMLDQFERDEQDRLAEIARREAAAAAGHPEDTTLVRCAWEQAHPDERCLVCAAPVEAAAAGCGDTARDSALHIEAVERFVHQMRTDGIVDLLSEAARIIIPGTTVSAWSEEDRAAVWAWACAPDASPRPAILGTAHVAADFTTSEAVPGDTFQSCRECGARLLSNKTGSDDGESFVAYPAGTLVGVDCPGANEPARYAKRGKKKS